ncbi:hypothetical protein OK016_02595 [Vibrio chagasii]|nr:hypothetical protein [Vibrio chagasii]
MLSKLVDDSAGIRQPADTRKPMLIWVAQESYMQAKKPNKGKSIAIIGSGPGG